jgi:hypothetical protein
MKVTIDNKNMELYIKLRGELNELFHKEFNSHNYTPSKDICEKVARHDVEMELKHPEGLVISIDEILLLDPADALKTFMKRKADRVHEDMKLFFEY